MENIPQSGHPPINDDTKLDILLTVEGDVGLEIMCNRQYEVCIAKKSLLQSNISLDRRLDFSEIMQDRCNNNAEYKYNSWTIPYEKAHHI